MQQLGRKAGAGVGGPDGIPRRWTGLLLTTCSVSPLAIVTTDASRHVCCRRPGCQPAGLP